MYSTTNAIVSDVLTQLQTKAMVNLNTAHRHTGRTLAEYANEQFGPWNIVVMMLGSLAVYLVSEKWSSPFIFVERDKDDETKMKMPFRLQYFPHAHLLPVLCDPLADIFMLTKQHNDRRRRRQHDTTKLKGQKCVPMCCVCSVSRRANSLKLNDKLPGFHFSLILIDFGSISCAGRKEGNIFFPLLVSSISNINFFFPTPRAVTTIFVWIFRQSNVSRLQRWIAFIYYSIAWFRFDFSWYDKNPQRHTWKWQCPIFCNWMYITSQVISQRPNDSILFMEWLFVMEE